MSRAFLSVLLASAIAALVPAGHAIQESPAPMVTWSEIEKGAGQRLGQRVCIQVQFHSSIDKWNPFMTRFGPREFSAVRAWADEQFPWVVTEFESPAARLFTRRGSEAERALAGAHSSARFELDVVVREVFFDRPWVEVLAARPLTEFIGEGTVIHARRGIELAQARAFDLAVAEYERAFTATLPARARGELERLQKVARESIPVR